MFDPATGISLDQLRARLRAMDDRMLKQWGQSAACMCPAVANLGAEPRPEFVLQLEEACAGGTASAPRSGGLRRACKATRTRES
jgi:hypothetical protein